MIRLLEGVRVVECAVLFNGDQTGRLLGDLGATVIKVEAPGVGDYLRDFLGQITPAPQPRAHVRQPQQAVDDARPAIRRGSTSLLRADQDRRHLRRRVRRRRVRATRHRLRTPASGQARHHLRAVQRLRRARPVRRDPDARPDDGRARRRRAARDRARRAGEGDSAASATAPWSARRTPPSPQSPRSIHRDRTGEGAYIDGAGSDAVLATQWFFATYAWNDARLTDRRGMAGGENSAKYHFYETSDGRYVLFCGIEPKFWTNFCRAVDRPDLIDASDDTAPVDFGGSSVGLAQTLAEIFRSRTQAEWTQIALDADIALGPAHQVDDSAPTRTCSARGIVHESVHPHAGPFTSVGWPAPVDGQPFDDRAPRAPARRAHRRDPRRARVRSGRDRAAPRRPAWSDAARCDQRTASRSRSAAIWSSE